jgi:hypothetical protein
MRSDAYRLGLYSGAGFEKLAISQIATPLL